MAYEFFLKWIIHIRTSITLKLITFCIENEWTYHSVSYSVLNLKVSYWWDSVSPNIIDMKNKILMYIYKNIKLLGNISKKTVEISKVVILLSLRTLTFELYVYVYSFIFIWSGVFIYFHYFSTFNISLTDYYITFTFSISCYYYYYYYILLSNMIARFPKIFGGWYICSANQC